MKDIFCPFYHTHNTRNHNLAYPNPKTVTYGLETFGYKASHIWNALSKEIQSSKNIKTFNVGIVTNQTYVPVIYEDHISQTLDISKLCLKILLIILTYFEICVNILF